MLGSQPLDFRELRNMINRAIILLFSLILLNNISFAAGDVERGKQLSQTCGACHGADGNSVTPIWPKLAGQKPKYLSKQMLAFKQGKDGGRYDPIMSPLMQNLSAQDMKDLAAYFASQKVTLAAVEPKTVVLGQQIYRGGIIDEEISACSACHSPRGLGNDAAGFPALSGQQVDYTVKQLKAYRSGERNNGLAFIMNGIAKRMTDEEIQQVAKYVSALH